MIPLFNSDGTSTCPLGFPMNQNRLAVPVWSYAMEVYPPARIIELGSYNGGFTTALGVHAYRIRCQIYSYDRMQAPNDDWKDLAKFLRILFFQRDTFDELTVKEVCWTLSLPGVCYLLCDNGDKKREFNLFAPSLKKGDVIAAHDLKSEHYWPWDEIRVADVAETVKAHGLERWMPEHFFMAGWLSYRKA